jgi:hypothetical protein
VEKIMLKIMSLGGTLWGLFTFSKEFEGILKEF